MSKSKSKLIVFLAVTFLIVTLNIQVFASTKIRVTKVSLSDTKLTIEIGNTAPLTATVYPDNATNQEITWSTSDSDVAEVDNGVVTAVGAGTATITVTSLDTRRFATCKVTVPPNPEDKVTFNDKKLERAVRRKIKKSSGDIYTSDFKNIVSLDLSSSSISDLSGIEKLTMVTGIILDDNDIEDLSPLEGLTNLKTLYLEENEIDDISPLKGLINLRNLKLKDNEISDISALKDLANLTSLNLNTNEISDASPLKDLTNLTRLDLGYNTVSDVTPFMSLINLTYLDITCNKVSNSDYKALKSTLPECHIYRYKYVK